MTEEKTPAIRPETGETDSEADKGVAQPGPDAGATLAAADGKAMLEKAEGAASARDSAETRPSTGATRRALASRLAQVAIVALVAGSGWFGAHMVSRGETAAALAPLATVTDDLRRGQEDILRLGGEVRTLKMAVEALRENLETTRGESTATQARLLERAEQGARDLGAQFARLTEQMQRIEAGIEKAALQPDETARLLRERFDRLEKTLAASSDVKTAPAAAPEPLQTASIPAPKPADSVPASKPADRDAPIEGWLLHEVYGGLALIEGRRGQLFEVGRGDVIPGAGRVEAIERRAKRWVVVTNRGLITTAR
ncbi:hypothetical protein [Microvirga massiliensis]|uniref:hypothetical protein n=1 Tax=Microvirga massiliensis TaxID=1033741 RepID=UPI0006616354|nr:hypothetical protein [Microvirga massiliensis]